MRTYSTYDSTTEFKPTYLYIKQHTITKKLYFGKSTRNEEGMLKYLGSGKHWKNHIKFHGKEYVTTLWYCLFYDKDDCTNFATMFSDQWQISESSDWLNFKPENGLDGSPKGVKRGPWSDERKLAQSNRMKGRKTKPHSEESKAKMSVNRKGKGLGPLSTEHKLKLSASLKGSKKPPRTTDHQKKLTGSFVKGQIPWNAGKEGCTRRVNRKTCPHCGLTGHPGTMAKYHFNNCKQKEKDNGSDSNTNNV